jgi:HD superfamily phosphodiesterase
MSLAVEEGLQGDSFELVELGALLHDICDWKYSGPSHYTCTNEHKCTRTRTFKQTRTHAHSNPLHPNIHPCKHTRTHVGSDTAGPEAVKAFLTEKGYGRADEVADLVSNVGFKKELGGGGASAVSPELAVVQDADRLDAIGACGKSLHHHRTIVTHHCNAPSHRVVAST